MLNLTTDSADLRRFWAPDMGAVSVGSLVDVTSEGKPLVDFPGNPAGPVEARVTVAPTGLAADAFDQAVPVLLVFEKQDPALPIIIGIVHDRLCPPTREKLVEVADAPREARVDGKRIQFDAKEEIVLRCGKSSITLRKDGKILVKGAQIVSHASGTNKIKGSSVAIN